MKCSNCGFESQEGTSRCRRCGEPLAATSNDQAPPTGGGGDEGFVDFSQEEEFTDFSQSSGSTDAPQQVQSTPPPPPNPSTMDQTQPQATLGQTEPQAPLDQTQPQVPRDQTQPQVPRDQTQPQASMGQIYVQPPPLMPLGSTPSETVVIPRQEKSKEPNPDAEYIDNYVFPTTPIVNEILFGKSGSTSPSIFLTAIIAVFLTLFFYKVFPIPTSTGYFHDLFTKRGVWPYASVLFFWWAICLEVNKFIRFLNQKKILKMDLFPPEYSRITSGNACKLQRYLLQIVPDPLSNVVTNRMWVGLQQFRNLGHLEEVNDLVQYQAEIDISTMESSFSFLNLLIWSHPIVGFLGTVVGIGTAIGGFSNVIESAVEIDAIKGALQVVTGGLSTAFDTTLIGLVFAMILMFTTTPLKKLEEDFLGDVDNFIIRQLLNRMRKKSGEMGEEEEEVEVDEGTRISKMIDDSFRQQITVLQGAFQTWQGGFSGVINQIGEETQALGQQFSAVTPIVTDFREVMTQFSNQVHSTAQQQEGMLQQIGAHVQQFTPLVGDFHKAVEGMGAQRQMINDQLVTWAGNFDKLGEGISEKFTQMGDKVSENIQKSGTGFLAEIEKHLKEQSSSVSKMNEGVTKEISHMSSGLIGKLENQISIFEKFQKDQTENVNSQSKNLDTLSSSITGEFTKMSETILSKLEGQVTTFQKFSDQYSNYMTDLMGGVSKEVVGITEKIVQQLQDQLSGWSQSLTKELAGNIGSVSASVAKEVTGMGENILKELGQSSQNMIKEIGKMTGDQNSTIENVEKILNEIGKMTGGQNSTIENVEKVLNEIGKMTGGQNSTIENVEKVLSEIGKMTGGQNSTIENIENVLKELENVNKMTLNASSDMAQKFESLFQFLSSLAEKQDRLVGAVTQSIEQMSSQEGLHRKSLEEFTKSASAQAEILEAFNSGIDKVTSGNMFKDTLDGIRSGIETIKPELQLLATNISNASKKSS